MMINWLDNHRNFVFLIVTLMTVGGGTLFHLNQPAPVAIEIIPAEATSTPTSTPTPLPTPTPAPVRIYITGAIHKADVYFLPQGSIIKDAILAAGGLTDNVDIEAFNQALELQDQQHIHIPRLGEADSPPLVQGGVENPPKSAQPTVEPEQTTININTASLELLDTLPNIGPKLGQSIIDYRESYGSFKQIEEIKQVSGIGEATFNRLKNLITVE